MIHIHCDQNCAGIQRFNPFDLALSEKQIPRFVGNVSSLEVMDGDLGVELRAPKAVVVTRVSDRQWKDLELVGGTYLKRLPPKPVT
jgi:hypothetical protein